MISKPRYYIATATATNDKFLIVYSARLKEYCVIIGSSVTLQGNRSLRELKKTFAGHSRVVTFKKITEKQMAQHCFEVGTKSTFSAAMYQAYGMSSNRFDNIVNNKWTRYTGQTNMRSVFQYKGSSFSTSDPETYKRFVAQNKAVGAAFRNHMCGDAGMQPVIDALQAMHYLSRAAYVQRIIEKLNIQIDDLDNTLLVAQCGPHITCLGLSVTVGPHAHQWCENCVDARAVEAQDQDMHWDMDHAYEHADGNFYSVSERVYADDDDDDDDDDDENNYGDHRGNSERDTTDNCQHVMRYNTNILNELHAVTNLKSSAFGDFTMGVEIEMTSGSLGVSDSVLDIRKQLGKEYCLIKSDGSLPNNGFEVVTMPAPLIEHIERVSAWKIKPEYRAWEAKKCGVHVHIDAKAFTKMTLGKFIIFINKKENESLIYKIAGRHPSKNEQAAEYCRAEHQEFMVNPAMAIKGKSHDAARYRMVNLCNIRSSSAERLGLNSDHYEGRYDTVELRIFRASLRKERLLSQIEFSHAAVMFVRAASYRELDEKSFIKWLGTTQNLYPNLAQWFGVRKVKENPRIEKVVASKDEPIAA